MDSQINSQIDWIMDRSMNGWIDRIDRLDNGQINEWMNVQTTDIKIDRQDNGWMDKQIERQIKASELPHIGLKYSQAYFI